MTKPVPDDEEEPLDPTLLRVQQKLRRLLLVSGSTMAIGILAVLVAVVIRLQRDADTPDGPAFASTLELPAGVALVATDVDGDRVAVTVEGPAGREIHVFHLATGRRLGTATLLAR